MGAGDVASGHETDPSLKSLCYGKATVRASRMGHQGRRPRVGLGVVRQRRFGGPSASVRNGAQAHSTQTLATTQGSRQNRFSERKSRFYSSP